MCHLVPHVIKLVRIYFDIWHLLSVLWFTNIYFLLKEKKNDFSLWCYLEVIFCKEGGGTGSRILFVIVLRALRLLSRDPSVEARGTNLVTMWVFGNSPSLPPAALSGRTGNHTKYFCLCTWAWPSCWLHMASGSADSRALPAVGWTLPQWLSSDSVCNRPLMVCQQVCVRDGPLSEACIKIGCFPDVRLRHPWSVDSCG